MAVSRTLRSPHDRHHRVTSRRGAALIELALVLPVLLILILGTCDFGRVGYDKIILTQASHLGCALGSQDAPPKVDRTAWEARIKSAVTDEVAQLSGYQESALEINVDVLQQGDMELVKVTVRHPFRLIVPWPSLGDKIVLKAETCMPVTP
jgi:Flp pilus assembly protein TadG